MRGVTEGQIAKPRRVPAGLLLPLLGLVVVSAGGEQPRPSCVAVPPCETWRAAEWPTVIVAAEAGADLAEVAGIYSPLTSPRGALLLAIEGGDAARLAEALEEARQTYSLRADATVLVGRDAMATWAREQVLSKPNTFAGLIAIDDPGIPIGPPEEAVKAATTWRQAACLLVLDAARMLKNRRIQSDLLERGLAAALRRVDPEQLLAQLGAALTALLPQPPPRTELFDPVTLAHFTALPGWEFVRHDRFFAIARLTDDTAGPIVEIATGGLGKRSFEDYVNDTLAALKVDGIELLESLRLSPPDAPIMLHSFRFLDHRGDEDRAVCWLQLGHDADLVSFRGVAPTDTFDSLCDRITELARLVKFDQRPSVVDQLTKGR